jgi:hypothetical protein
MLWEKSENVMSKPEKNFKRGRFSEQSYVQDMVGL